MVLIAESDANQKLPKVNFEVLSEVTSTFVETDSINELDVLLGDGLYGIDQISEIVLNLKNFSRLDRSHVDLHDINSGVETTLKIAQNIVKRRMISKFFGDVPLIQCSPSQINQVLLNLITNACQATSDDGGKVAIITKRYRDGLIVQVVDNGHGIPPEAKTKIFDPFFTTKKVGEGTGLGLSIVQRIVKEHGGRISVSSQVGRGTGFTVYLPEKQALEMVGQQA